AANKHFGRWRFVFLQHGVIKHDLSRWLNGIQIDRMITSTYPEYISIVARTSNYRLSQKEVVLTGMPRHDRLISSKCHRKYIVIMPTWRRYLFDRFSVKELSWEATDRFECSEFVRRWRSLLSSERLKKIAERFQLDILFVPHPILDRH